MNSFPTKLQQNHRGISAQKSACESVTCALAMYSENAADFVVHSIFSRRSENSCTWQALSLWRTSLFLGKTTRCVASIAFIIPDLMTSAPNLSCRRGSCWSGLHAWGNYVQHFATSIGIFIDTAHVSCFIYLYAETVFLCSSTTIIQLTRIFLLLFRWAYSTVRSS